MNNIYKYLIIIIACIICFVCYNYYFYNQNRKIINPEQIIIRDTIIKTIPSKPIVINKVKTKIKYIKDTIITTKPFIAIIDTIYKTDTIKIEYEFPENLLSLRIYKQPDTTKIERITQINTSKQKSYWWEIPAYICSGALLGFLLSKINK